MHLTAPPLSYASMNHITRFKFRVDRSHLPYHVVTVHTPWRKMPFVLDTFRSLQLDVRKAYLTQEQSTLFLQQPTGLPLCEATKQDILQVLDTGIVVNERERYKELFASPFKLPADTTVHLFNVPEQPYTTLEFFCADRVGLLCDILDFLSSFPIEIHTAHISTMEGYAHNILLLTRGGHVLDEADMEYIHNVFEYEVKHRVGCEGPPSE